MGTSEMSMCGGWSVQRGRVRGHLSSRGRYGECSRPTLRQGSSSTLKVRQKNTNKNTGSLKPGQRVNNQGLESTCGLEKIR